MLESPLKIIPLDQLIFRSLHDSNEAIMITDLNSTLIYVNPAWETIYGFSSPEALGQTPRLLHSGHHPASFYSEMWDSIRNPKIGFWKGEITNRSKDGKLIQVLLSIHPLRKDGVLYGYMGISLDLSNQKKLEAKVFHQDQLASIGLLASGIAHEVGTPLGVIRGRAEMLFDDRETNESTKQGLDVIISQIDRITKIIQNLLRVSRPIGTPQREPFSLHECTNSVLTLVERVLAAEGIVLNWNVQRDHHALGDANRMEQIILNLVMNAIHAMKKKESPTHSLHIKSELRHQKTVLIVKDTGMGIPEENLSKIFNPFFTTKDVGEGTGLGLAMVLQYLREMNGEILVQSKINEGSTFTLVLDHP